MHDTSKRHVVPPGTGPRTLHWVLLDFLAWLSLRGFWTFDPELDLVVTRDFLEARNTVEVTA